jgi:hypothetical protein
MAPVVAWIVVALVTALVVIVGAGTATGRNRRGIRQFVADLRSRNRHAPDAGSIGLLAGARQELRTSAEAEEGSVADLFSIGEVPERAYVEPAVLAEPIVRATRRTLHLARRARA